MGGALLSRLWRGSAVSQFKTLTLFYLGPMYTGTPLLRLAAAAYLLLEIVM